MARGNAGNQITTAGPATIENSILVGHCSFHQRQSFTFNVDPCAGQGNSLAMTLFPGNRANVVNSTIAGQGSYLVAAACDQGGGCDGTEKATLRNNIFLGALNYLLPFENTALLGYAALPANPFDADYSLIGGIKNNTCPGIHDYCNAPPGIANSGLSTFDARLLAGSAAINHGTPSGAPTVDFSNAARDATPDIGAYEYRTQSAGPSNLVATASGTGLVNVTWTATSGASYEIGRKIAGLPFAVYATTTVGSFADTGVSAGNAYAYRVRRTYADGLRSAYSNVDLTTTIPFTSDPLTAGLPLLALHLSEIRQAVNAVRATAGLSAYVWTDDPLNGGTPVKRIHLVEMRSALDGARTALGLSNAAYTDPTITAGITLIRATHLQQLRDRVK